MELGAGKWRCVTGPSRLEHVSVSRITHTERRVGSKNLPIEGRSKTLLRAKRHGIYSRNIRAGEKHSLIGRVG